MVNKGRAKENYRVLILAPKDQSPFPGRVAAAIIYRFTANCFVAVFTVFHKNRSRIYREIFEVVFPFLSAHLVALLFFFAVATHVSLPFL